MLPHAQELAQPSVDVPIQILLVGLQAENRLLKDEMKRLNSVEVDQLCFEKESQGRLARSI